MTEGFKKILELIRRTGDRMVFYEADSDSSFVIVPLAEYERLIGGSDEIRGLTEGELLARINRDIAIWRDEQKSPGEPVGETLVASAEIAAVTDKKEETPVEAEDVYHFEPIEDDEAE